MADRSPRASTGTAQKVKAKAADKINFYSEIDAPVTTPVVAPAIGLRWIPLLDLLESLLLHDAEALRSSGDPLSGVGAPAPS